ncbi:MAG TPA: hypothetical protein VFZ65_18420 [Planctomycetota bacterium]|nr:hypothetical protein [Planctomycetota bacterium]
MTPAPVGRVHPVRALLLLALAAPLLALWPASQDPAAADWSKDVELSATSPRYGLRLAAARKVAAAGAAAVPAIRAFTKQHGLDQVPLALVEQIADQTSVEPAVFDLLVDWATDKDFYWRPQAMRGLAQRAALAPDRRQQLAQLFAAYEHDPAWLTRTHARFGKVMLGEQSAVTMPEADPRARVRFARLLLGAGRTPPLQPLFDALADERTFQGDPWGQRVGLEAHKALVDWLGDAHPLGQGESYPDKQAGIEALLGAARTKSGQALQTPRPAADPDTPFGGGIEVLSCKQGDLFVQWTDDGLIQAGIDGAVHVQLPAKVAADLARERTALALEGNLGVVICDTMRLRWTTPPVHVKVAPRSLPAPTSNWLKHLAQAIEEAGEPGLAASLRAGLEQFAAP